MFRVGAFGELKEIRGGSRELRDIMSDNNDPNPARETTEIP